MCVSFCVVCDVCGLMLFVGGSLLVVARGLLVAVVAGCCWLFVVCCWSQCGVGRLLLAVCNW